MTKEKLKNIALAEMGKWRARGIEMKIGVKTFRLPFDRNRDTEVFELMKPMLEKYFSIKRKQTATAEKILKLAKMRTDPARPLSPGAIAALSKEIDLSEKESESLGATLGLMFGQVRDCAKDCGCSLLGTEEVSLSNLRVNVPFLSAQRPRLMNPWGKSRLENNDENIYRLRFESIRRRLTEVAARRGKTFESVQDEIHEFAERNKTPKLVMDKMKPLIKTYFEAYEFYFLTFAGVEGLYRVLHNRNRMILWPPWSRPLTDPLDAWSAKYYKQGLVHWPGDRDWALGYKA